MGDEVKSEPESKPPRPEFSPKLGAAGRLAERFLGPMLEKPGGRARDYSRADAGLRAVIALCVALGGFGTLIVWQAKNSAEQSKEARAAYERLTERMITSSEKMSELNRQTMKEALDAVKNEIKDSTRATKDYTEAMQQQKGKR